jgi:diaminopimelate epimerase
MTGPQFYKMTGSGNDFVMLDGRMTTAEDWPTARIQAICDRRHGVGADGLVILAPTGAGVVRMRYWNSDGSPGAMCGNAALCSARLAVTLKMVASGEFCLLTDAGTVQVRAAPQTNHAEIRLPDFLIPAEPLEIPRIGGESWMAFLTVGVPHLVLGVEDVEAVDVVKRGRALRSDPILGPEGANVNFISRSPDSLGPWSIRTYERGVEAETLACGTGTVAAGVALAYRGDERLPIKFRSRGGLLLEVRADISDSAISNVWLGGEGRLVFQGRLGATS